MSAGITFDLLWLSELSHQERDLTAETLRTLSKEFLIKKYSELCTAIVEIVRKLR